MAHWIILKRDNQTHFLNLDQAYQIVQELHDKPAQSAYTLHFPNERITIRNDANPATYGHISAYLGVLQDESILKRKPKPEF